jgi:L-lysine 2,3-aminomutase
MSCKPIYEFLLWDNCNNNCKFCFQRELPRLFGLKQREQILNKTTKAVGFTARPPL